MFRERLSFFSQGISRIDLKTEFGSTIIFSLENLFDPRFKFSTDWRKPSVGGNIIRSFSSRFKFLSLGNTESEFKWLGGILLKDRFKDSRHWKVPYRRIKEFIVLYYISSSHRLIKFSN